AIEDVGGVLSVGASGGSVRVLTPDRTLGLELLFDCIMRPSFPNDALERKRAQAVSALIDQEQRADARAAKAFQEMVYPPGHPYHRPALGLRPIVEKLTAADCRAFHAARFVPNSTVVAVVGDFKPNEAIAEITRLTADWKPGQPPKPALPEAHKPETFV